MESREREVFEGSVQQGVAGKQAQAQVNENCLLAVKGCVRCRQMQGQRSRGSFGGSHGGELKA